MTVFKFCKTCPNPPIFVKIIFLKQFSLKHYSNSIKSFSIIAMLSMVFFTSCTSIDVFEKNVAIPKHQWNSSFKPEFRFNITDTSSVYQLYMLVRHNEKYHFNNIWINLYSTPPGDTAHKAGFELPLATNEKGWLGSSMDDIYEHRIKLTEPIKMKAGEYHFALEHMMREDPLQNVMNVGLRVEKIQATAN
jgi:gliding motility-associated lipoprotein GldH